MGRREDLLLSEARAHLHRGDPERALAALARILRDRPGHAEALSLAALAHQARGDGVRAVHFAEQALRVRESVEARLALAHALALAGRRDEALATLAPLTLGEPVIPLACLRYARLLSSLGRADESEQLAATWCRRLPDEPLLAQARCEALASLGDAPGLFAALRHAVACFPARRAFAEWLAGTALYLDDLPEEAVLDLARAHGARLPRAPGGTPRPRAPDEPVRVGLLSPDLRTHSVSFFLRPLLAHLDPARVRVFLYDTGDRPDAVTEELRSLASGCLRCRALPDEAIAARVRADAIDILLDLAGLTRGATPGVLAARAAPVQVNFLGYANFTCLPGVDARVGDSITDPPADNKPPAPPGPGRQRAGDVVGGVVGMGVGVEPVVRLDPCFLCYAPPPDLPVLREPARDTVAFGSFNALLKVSPRCLRLWARVLREVPASRLVLKAAGLECQAVRRRLTESLASRGVEPGRLDLRPLTPSLRDHLDTYHDVDIALDTFPYHGTTTTCEALVMGVPVLSLAGNTHRARVGASLLAAARLAANATGDEDALVARAAALAREGVRTLRHRADLRRQVLGSTLCDAAAYARRFEALARYLAASR